MRNKIDKMQKKFFYDQVIIDLHIGNSSAMVQIQCNDVVTI